LEAVEEGHYDFGVDPRPQVSARVIDRLSMSQQIVKFAHRLDFVAGET
jgi:hypothetical protein